MFVNRLLLQVLFLAVAEGLPGNSELLSPLKFRHPHPRLMPL